MCHFYLVYGIEYVYCKILVGSRSSKMSPLPTFSEDDNLGDRLFIYYYFSIGKNK